MNTDNISEEANQLRLTCRQLHHEMTGVGLRYNKITFVDTRYKSCRSAYQNFSKFFEDISLQQLRRLRSVILLDPSSHVSNISKKCSYLSLVEIFCNNFPAATVVIRLNVYLFSSQYEGKKNALEYLACMEAVYQARYGQHVFPDFFTVDINPPSQQESSQLLHKAFCAAEYPANLRFSFRHGFEEYLVRLALQMEYTHSDVEAKLDVARKLHESGV